MRRLWWCAGLLLALGLVSCRPGSPTPSATNPSGDAKVAAEISADTGRGLRVRPSVNTFPGRWGLVVVQPMQDQQKRSHLAELCLALLQISDDNSKGEVLATVDERFELKLDRLAVKGQAIEIDFTGPEGKLEFRGSLDKGLVRGSLTTAQGVQPASLKPTDETDFKGWDFSPPAAGAEVFDQAVRQKDQPAGFLTAAKELRGNPLSLELYHGVVQRLPQFADLNEDQIREIAADYASSAALWGPRPEMQALLTTVTNVTMTRRFPKLALELADKIDSTTDKPPSADQTLKLIREQAEIDIALQKLRSSDEAQQAEGYAELKERLSNQRYNPELLHALGEHALKLGQKEAAQEYFSDIVALPMLEAMWVKQREGQPPGDPSPRERLLTLWEEQHGSIEGFEEFLEKTYHTRMDELLEQTKSAGPEPVAADAGNHLVLVELFTGVFCPPCVAGDLAVTALRQTYPTSKLVAIQFHQHIPLPDQLCNQDSEDRLGYYAAGGTPAAFVDGFAPGFPGVGGTLQHVQQAYSVIRPLVDARLKVTSDVAITATAHVENGELSVEATVTGVPDEQLPQTRLRLALTENRVKLLAPNGIREHEHVVREMLGGAKGTGVKGGKLAYSVQMPLAELKQHLVDYLHQFEVGRDVKFAVKPLDLKPLSLVAWVQNDQSHEVLQTVVVPVTGDLVYPGEETAEAPASATSPANAP
uniref:Thioredoxin domain-containing protein n=1 Tax=Schlesneria paludicola TaxID=360056 RepID=A0A7C2JZA3_9PLAN